MFIAHIGKPEGDTLGVDFFEFVEGIWLGEIQTDEQASQFLAIPGFHFYGGAVVPVRSSVVPAPADPPVDPAPAPEEPTPKSKNN